MKEIIFIRHYETAGNRSGCYIGRTDEPIIESGEHKRYPIDMSEVLLFVSPMLRCTQTADILFPEVPRTVVDALRECDFGVFEGKTAGELSGCDKYSAWLAADCLTDIPGGDSVTGFKQRCCDAFLEIAEIPGERTVVVTHGGVIMAILERFGYPKRSFYEYHLPNGGSVSRNYVNGLLIE